MGCQKSGLFGKELEQAIKMFKIHQAKSKPKNNFYIYG